MTLQQVALKKFPQLQATSNRHANTCMFFAVNGIFCKLFSEDNPLFFARFNTNASIGRDSPLRPSSEMQCLYPSSIRAREDNDDFDSSVICKVNEKLVKRLLQIKSKYSPVNEEFSTRMNEGEEDAIAACSLATVSLNADKLLEEEIEVLLLGLLGLRVLLTTLFLLSWMIRYQFNKVSGCFILSGCGYRSSC